MFKVGNSEYEIMQSMEKSLTTYQTEKHFGFDKITKAADLLNNAAEIFEKVGMHQEAEEILGVLHSLADQLNNSKISDF